MPVVSDDGGPERPDRFIWYFPLAQSIPQPRSLSPPPYLIRINHHVDVIPLLDLDHTQDIMDPQLLQLRDGQRCRQRRNQHIGLCKRLKHVRRHILERVPFQRLLQQVFLAKLATRLLEFQMRLLVVRRRQPGKVRRFREGDDGSRRHGVLCGWLTAS